MDNALVTTVAPGLSDIAQPTTRRRYRSMTAADSTSAGLPIYRLYRRSKLDWEYPHQIHGSDNLECQVVHRHVFVAMRAGFLTDELRADFKSPNLMPQFVQHINQRSATSRVSA